MQQGSRRKLATSGPAFLPDGQHGGWDVLVVGEAMRKILRIASKGLRVPNLAQYVGTWANRMNNVHFSPAPLLHARGEERGRW